MSDPQPTPDRRLKPFMREVGFVLFVVAYGIGVSVLAVAVLILFMEASPL